MASPVFELSGGRVVLGGSTVLESIDFRLEAGEFVALLGDNGAGKTTLVKALLGLLPLRSGSLRLFSTPIGRFRDWQRVGYVPQRSTASAGLPASVFEVVLSGRAVRSLLPGYSGYDREMARRALAEVAMEPRARDPLHELSGGQQQRVLIARALAMEPDVLVLDEPAIGIDLESQEALGRTLETLKKQGRSVLLVAHGLGAMEPLVSRTVVMQGGIVTYDGEPLAAAIARGHLHVHHHPDEELAPDPLGGIVKRP